MTTTETEFAAPQVFSLFPATVLDPVGAVAYRKVRAIATPRWLVIYGDDRRADGKLIARTQAKIPAVSVRPHPRNGWIVVDDTGAEWTVTAGSGCGCGSALRHLPSPVPLDL